MQCGHYFSQKDACKNHGHDQVILRLEDSISDDSLNSFLGSVFAAYKDRPCLGIPSGSSVQWKWLSYLEVKSRVAACIRSLEDSRDKFLVAAFDSLDFASNLELIAFDLAAAILGACSVIAHGKDHAQDLVAILGQDRCRIVDSDSVDQAQDPQDPQDPMQSMPFDHGKDDGNALFSLFATSGSVGNPKLVRRTRSSWLDTVKDTIQFSDNLCITLNFTSLAHSAARTELWWNLGCGGQTALANHQHKFLDSLVELCPTEIAAPPAVWAEIRDEFRRRDIKDFGALRCKIERLVRNLHTVSTGTAPCEDGLYNFLKTIFGPDIAVFNNYGATEIGSIALDGKVNQDLKVKLVELPEQGIHSPQGELCIYVDPDDSIFEGYYSEDHCKEVMTDDGYYRTGDIAERISDNSEIRIVGRVSSVVKLANGKFESLESMDIQVLQSLQAKVPSVQQVCTLEIGGALVAVVYAPGTTELPILPIVPCICSDEPFTVKNGMLTPSMKLCRRRVLAKHEHLLRKLVDTQRTQADHGGYDRVTDLLATIMTDSMDCFDESRPLRDFGITSIHLARIAAIWNIPVYLLAQTSTLRDLKDLKDTSDGQGLGVKAAETDIQNCIQCVQHWKPWKDLQLHQPLDLPAESETAWKVVVVTGATGYVGSCFVDLLVQRGLQVIRIARSLGHDVGKPNCGMSNEEYSRCVAADAVIHCAAIVNWNANYSDLREANVLSVVNITKLCTEGRLKPLLFIGSGITFPEEPPDLNWLQECANPYMVSKIGSELLVRKLHQQTVVVRAGMIVWHSQTGAYNPSDAYVRLIQSINKDSLVWKDDDFMDGMNVDAFCGAAYELFQHGAFNTYNLCGHYKLSSLLKSFQPVPKKVSYAEWYKMLTQHADDHPLGPLLPNISAHDPPFVTWCQSSESSDIENYENYLTTKCARALGSKLAQHVVNVRGYEAFVQKLTEKVELPSMLS